MDWNGAIEQQRAALTRMVAMLAAMSGLIEAARLRLPPDIHYALLAPLRLAEEAARAIPVSESGLPLAFGPVAAARLRRCLVLLCRTIAMLRRRLLMPGQPAGAAGKLTQYLRDVLAGVQHPACRSPEQLDTS